MSKRASGLEAVGEDVDERAAKRRKIPTENIDRLSSETTEKTTQHGLELLEIIRKTKDNNGRLIATDFLTLPSKRLLPDYYKVIKMPIALDTIETKLQRREFPNLTALESYFTRMLLNAKEYNAKWSMIHEDAERLTQAILNYMTKYNPAYKKTPGYVSFPTPLPGDDGEQTDGKDAEEDRESEMEERPARRLGRSAKNHQTLTQRSSATPASSDLQYSGIGFEGLTFQQAQEKIVEDLITEKETAEDNFGTFEPFITLPSRRDYKDYYNVIPHPIALKDLQKAVKGIRARTPGVSEFKTWAAFEAEASYMWKNAYHYNEDNSDIFILAKKLEAFFNIIFMKAKAAVSEPVSTKIKLRMPEPTKITLKIGAKASSADPPAPQTTRQLAPEVNGSKGTTALLPADPDSGARRNPCSTASTLASTPTPTPDQLQQARSVSGSSPSPPVLQSAPVRSEEPARNPPVIPTSLNGNGGTSKAVSIPDTYGNGMQPPTTPTLTNTYSQGGYAQSFNHQTQYQTTNPSFDSKWREPGKDSSDAMITNLSIATHPGLNISRHFRMDLPPSSTLAQQSITINLPSTHYYLQIKPSIAASMMQRPHKLFVTTNTQRLHGMPTIPGHPIDPRHPLFEARLLPGVNRIEIELIAVLPKYSKNTNGQDVELEKITIFANLMKA